MATGGKTLPGSGQHPNPILLQAQWGETDHKTVEPLGGGETLHGRSRSQMRTAQSTLQGQTVSGYRHSFHEPAPNPVCHRGLPVASRISPTGSPNMQGGMKAMWAAYHQWKHLTRTTPANPLAISRATTSSRRPKRTSGRQVRPVGNTGSTTACKTSSQLRPQGIPGLCTDTFAHLPPNRPKRRSSSKVDCKMRPHRSNNLRHTAESSMLLMSLRIRLGPHELTFVSTFSRPSMPKPWHLSLHTRPHPRAWPPTLSGGWWPTSLPR